MRRKIMFAVVPLVLAGALLGAGCASKADVASSNISKAAEQFQVPRRIVFVNGITDKILYVVTGYCSVETANAHIAGSIEVTCAVKRGNTTLYYRDNLGLSDNVTYMVEQLDPINVSVNHYTVLFRPQTLIPDFKR